MPKPSSLINTSFADEVAPPQKFRVKRMTTRDDDRIIRNSSKAAEEGQQLTPSSAPTEESTLRLATRSLSPKKIRKNVVGTMSPMFSPVVKGLRRLSRSTVRSQSPSTRRASESELPASASHKEGEADTVGLPANAPLTGQRSQSTPENVFDAFATFSHARPKRLSDVEDFDVKALIPPSGRFVMPSDDEEDDDDENQSRTIRPPPRTTTPPPSKPTSSTSTASQKNSKSLPSTGNATTSKPLSWSSHHSKHKPPSSSSAGSKDGNSSSKKLSSGSSASEMPPRPKRPSGSEDKKREMERRNLPRRAQKKSDELGNSTDEPSKTKEDPTTTPKSSKPRRARSATPRRQSRHVIPPDETSKNHGTTTLRGESFIVPSAASTDIDTARQLRSSQNSSSRRHRSVSKESNPRVHPEPSNSAIVSEPTNTTSQDGKLRRTRSRSQDASTVAHGVGLENPPKESAQNSKTRAGAHQRSSRARRHHSAPHADEDNSGGTSRGAAAEDQQLEKAPRRGKKSSGQAEATLRAKASGNAREADSLPKPNSGRHIGRQHRSHQQQNQQHDSEKTPDGDAKSDGKTSQEATEAKPEKPGSGRRLAVEDFRKNLGRETLEHVKSLKNEIKQMRTHRRKVQFPVKEPDTANHGPSRSISDDAQTSKHHQQQQQQPQYVSKTSNWQAGGKTRSHSQPSDTLTSAVRQQSNYHYVGSTGYSSKSGEAYVSNLDTQPPRKKSEPTPMTKLMTDFNSSIGAISLEDLDMGYMKPTAPLISEQEERIQSLRKRIKKTKKLIKRTTRDVWTEREEIITLQRKNWTIRKALMQNEGPTDSLTTLNMKIEKFLRQERELDLESDRMHEEKDALEANCAETTQAISEFKELFDKLNKTIVPLLPPPVDAPEEVDPSQSGTENVSPLASPTNADRRAFVNGPASALPSTPVIDVIDNSEMMEGSMHSTEEGRPTRNNEKDKKEEEEGSLSLPHLRRAMSSSA